MGLGRVIGMSALFTLALAANDGGLTLDSSLVQKGSTFDGQDGLGADAGQAPSATSTNNFINFCQGKTLTNGLQQVQGSCNGIVMGDIPAKNKMVSSIIVNPQNNDKLTAGKDFNITVQVANLVAGSFTNADTTYYAAPQSLQNGQVVGHTHVTVQDLGNTLNPTTPLDATQFAFFKGINDAGNGKGLLSAAVTGGLPAGNYRLCTLTSASNHQPVIMAVAQRGSQDDCVRFTVTGNGGTTNVAASDGSKGQAAAAAVASAVQLGPGAITAGGSGAAATSSANSNNNKGSGSKAAATSEAKAAATTAVANNKGTASKSNNKAAATSEAKAAATSEAKATATSEAKAAATTAAANNKGIASKSNNKAAATSEVKATATSEARAAATSAAAEKAHSKTGKLVRLARRRDFIA